MHKHLNEQSNATNKKNFIYYKILKYIINIIKKNIKLSIINTAFLQRKKNK